MTHSRAFSIVISALAGMVFVAPSVQARTCSGNGDVIGSYAYVGSRAGYFLLGATPPGSTSAGISGPLIPVASPPPGTTGAVGTNPWSKLIGNLVGNAAFASTGRVFADGLGALFFTDTTTLTPTTAQVGTYIVNSDCSLTMSLRDPFPATAGGVITPTGGPTIVDEGEVIDGRIEAVVTTTNAAGATISFVRTSQFNACTIANLNGSYGVAGSGVVVPGAILPAAGTIGGLPIGTPGAPGSAFDPGVLTTFGTPFNMLGRATADGNGSFVPDAASAVSPVKRTLLGTYVVNLDCTGTAVLIDSATGTTRNISFVLVNELPASLPNSVTTGAKPSLRFVFIDPGVIGSGASASQ